MVKRVRSKRTFRTCCRKLILHVYMTMKEEASIAEHAFGLNQPQARAAHALGISRTSIYRLERNDKSVLKPGDTETRERGDDYA